MGVPKPEFPPARRLTSAEAACLADEALARARAALHRDGPPVLPGANPAARPGAARRQTLSLRLSPARAIAPWAEALVIAGSALACLLIWLVQRV
jgi:hypothetical protein